MTASRFDTLIATLNGRRAELLADIRARLHADGAQAPLAMVNHIEETGDWIEASTETLNDLAWLQHEIGELRSIDAALQRAKTGAYGVCAECGVEIPLARLQAKPDASTCVGCQTRIEARRPR